MKRILANILMAAGLTVPFVANLSAQTNPSTAEIPFAFVANHVHLAAGTYRVSQPMQGAPSVFALADSRGGKIFVNLGGNETGQPDKPSLTFACYGKECVLAKVTPPNSQVAYAAPKYAVERSFSHSVGMASMVSIKLSR